MGSTPWNALVFLTLYMQTFGMSDGAASILVSVFLGGSAVGGLLGGWLGDLAASRFPTAGRIAVCQFSVFVGVPLSILLFKASHVLLPTLLRASTRVPQRKCQTLYDKESPRTERHGPEMRAAVRFISFRSVLLPHIVICRTFLCRSASSLDSQLVCKCDCRKVSDCTFSMHRVFL